MFWITTESSVTRNDRLGPQMLHTGMDGCCDAKVVGLGLGKDVGDEVGPLVGSLVGEKVG